jgi:peptidoglycan/xylan/chitin deacetylase (PgdA/CDA1 family)
LYLTDSLKWFVGGVVLVAALSIALIQTGAIGNDDPFPQPTPVVLNSSLTPVPWVAPAASAPPPAPTPFFESPGTPQTQQFDVPILQYHRVLDYDAALAAGADTAVSTQAFADEMAYLACAGYTSMTVTQLLAAIDGDIALPERPVVITFDDGYLEHYTSVYPIMRQHGQLGSFAIVTDFIGSGEMYMTWDQVREMSGFGMEMMSHTVSHVSLGSVEPEEARAQIEDARAIITEQTGRDVTSFVYPAGEPFRTGDGEQQAMVMQMLEDTGHRAGLLAGWYNITQDPHAPFQLQRLRVTGDMGIETFAASMYGPSPGEAPCTFAVSAQ